MKDYTNKTHNFHTHRLVVIDHCPVYYCRRCKKIIPAEELDR